MPILVNSTERSIPMRCTAYYASPVGTIAVTQEDDAIVSLVFTDNATSSEAPVTPLLCDCFRWLDDYFAGKNPDPQQIPVRLSGTPFQQEVWDILKSIPYGQSMTYGQIAKQISPKMSAQAVGSAVGSNPVPVIVPCHRVLGTGGKLTGYEFGLAIKRALLDLEEIPYRK